MKYKWTDRAVCNYYHDRETGSIVGKLSRINFSDDVWHAEINGDFLGDYISEAHGREAIEKRVKKIDAESANLINKVPKGLIDPKSYYEGYEDGEDAILRKAQEK